MNRLPFDVNIIAELAGEGATVTDEIELNSGLTMLAYESENIENEWLTADLEQTDGDDRIPIAIEELVSPDDINEVTGASLVAADGDRYLLDIDTAGEWVIHVAQPRAPSEEVRTLPLSASGQDSAVVGPIEISDGMTVIGDHKVEDGEDYRFTSFNVRAFQEDATNPLRDADYAFIEDAGFEGEARVNVDGVTWIEVRTRGEWTLEFEN